MEERERDAMIVKSTVQLAHNLGLNAVAEGVESAQVWQALAALGCHQLRASTSAARPPPSSLLRGCASTPARSARIGVSPPRDSVHA